MRIFKHPIKKLTLMTAFGGGYVLGAKAGRERYEQIRDAAQQVKADPRVQQATAQAEDLVRDAAGKVTENPRVKDVVSRAEEALSDAGLKSSGEADSAAGGADPSAGVATKTQDQGDDKDKAGDNGETKDAPKPAPKPKAPPKPQDPSKADDGNGTVHPLLADEHIEPDEQVVYTSGPDIEETIDELIDTEIVPEPNGDQPKGTA